MSSNCVLPLPLGITQVRFLDYAWASWLGMLPGTFAYVYLGSLGKVAADAAGDGTAGDGGFGTAKVVLYGEQQKHWRMLGRSQCPRT